MLRLDRSIKHTKKEKHHVKQIHSLEYIDGSAMTLPPGHGLRKMAYSGPAAPFQGV